MVRTQYESVILKHLNLRNGRGIDNYWTPDHLDADVAKRWIEKSDKAASPLIAFAWQTVKVTIIFVAQSAKPSLPMLPEQAEPPAAGEFVVGLFAKKKYARQLMDDMAADYFKDLAAGMSKRRADLRYMGAVFRTVGPQMWAATKRIGIVAALFGATKKFFG